ncbi:uncharacterized protein CBL_08443 [Carabus blaptoides fortunei]
MFKRKLQALDYPAADNVNVNNTREFRSIILWLEDQKIRHYKIEDRQELRQLDSDNWTQSFDKYRSDIACPIVSENNLEQLQWILAYAVRLEYADSKEKYRPKEEITKTSTPNVVVANPLDNMDFNSPDFKNGVNALAKILQLAQHPDHLVTLKAVQKIVCKRLNPDAIEKPNTIIIKGTPFPYQDANLGFDLGDAVLNQAAKILRLLYIQNLRQLQTNINELIVAVQSVTANPKTDTKLGKVGK